MPPSPAIGNSLNASSRNIKSFRNSGLGHCFKHVAYLWNIIFSEFIRNPFHFMWNEFFLPVGAIENPPNRSVRYTEHFPNFLLLESPFKCPNFTDHFFGQLFPGIFNAIPFSRLHHVLLVGSNIEVVRVAAFRVVALMENLHTEWNVPLVNQVRQSLRGNIPASGGSATNRSISECVLGSNPFPAPILDDYLFPKSRLDRFGKALLRNDLRGKFRLFVHNLTVLTDRALGHINGARAFAFNHSNAEVSIA